MKRFGKAMIVAGCMVVSGVIFGCIGNAIIYVSGETTKNDPVYEEKYYSIAVSEIDKIDLDMYSDNITIKPGDGDEIEITYWDEAEEPKIQISERNGTLLIDKKSSGTFHLFYIPTFQDLFDAMDEDNAHEMTITVPQSYVGEYDLDISSGSIYMSELTVEGEVIVYGTSGSITIEDVECMQDIRADITSGFLKLQNVEAQGDYKSYLTSGNTQLEDMTVAGDFEVNFTSGSINVTNVDVEGDATFENTSGGVSCDGFSAKEVYLNATSGDYDLIQVAVEEGIYLDATSGDFTISLSDKMENYSIDTDLTSGSCNLPQSYVNGEKQIWVSLTSGSAKFSFEGDADIK